VSKKLKCGEIDKRDQRLEQSSVKNGSVQAPLTRSLKRVMGQQIWEKLMTRLSRHCADARHEVWIDVCAWFVDLFCCSLLHNVI